MSDDNWKLQSSFKAGEVLINARGGDVDEWVANMRAVYANAQAILQTQQLLNGASVVQDTFAPAATQPAGQAVVTQAAPAPVQTEDPAPSCKHGLMVYRKSKPGAARKWQAYFCPTPKGTPDQCEPNFFD